MLSDGLLDHEFGDLLLVTVLRLSVCYGHNVCILAAPTRYPLTNSECGMQMISHAHEMIG